MPNASGHRSTGMFTVPLHDAYMTGYTLRRA